MVSCYYHPDLIKTELVVFSPPVSKLGFVKFFKDLTGWGLKESKDWIDRADSSDGTRPSVVLYMDRKSIDRVQSEIGDYFKGQNQYHFTGVQQQRHQKLTDLGILDTEDKREICIKAEINQIKKELLESGDSELLKDIINKGFKGIKNLTEDEVEERFSFKVN